MYSVFNYENKNFYEKVQRLFLGVYFVYDNSEEYE